MIGLRKVCSKQIAYNEIDAGVIAEGIPLLVGRLLFINKHSPEVQALLNSDPALLTAEQNTVLTSLRARLSHFQELFGYDPTKPEVI